MVRADSPQQAVDLAAAVVAYAVGCMQKGADGYQRVLEASTQFPKRLPTARLQPARARISTTPPPVPFFLDAALSFTRKADKDLLNWVKGRRNIAPHESVVEPLKALLFLAAVERGRRRKQVGAVRRLCMPCVLEGLNAVASCVPQGLPE
jgi:hypothetical protein